MPSTDADPAYTRGGIALVAILALADSILVAQSLLRGLFVAAVLALVYLGGSSVYSNARGGMERRVEQGGP